MWVRLCGQDEELEGMKKRVREWSKQRLQDEGYALFDLSVRPDGRLYRYVCHPSTVLEGHSSINVRFVRS